MIARSFFTDWLSLILAVLVMLPGFYHFRRIGIIRIFVIYALLSFLQTSTTLIIMLYNPFNWVNSPLIEISVNIFVLFEAIAFMIFFYKAFSESKRRIVLAVSVLLFAFIIWDRTIKSSIYQLPNSFTIVEGMVFLFLSVTFYLQLFAFHLKCYLKDIRNFYGVNFILH